MAEKTTMMHLLEKIERMPEENIKNYLKILGILYLESEKKQIIDAVEWNYKSNMGEVYYKATYETGNI